MYYNRSILIIPNNETCLHHLTLEPYIQSSEKPAHSESIAKHRRTEASKISFASSKNDNIALVIMTSNNIKLDNKMFTWMVYHSWLFEDAGEVKQALVLRDKQAFSNFYSLTKKRTTV